MKRGVFTFALLFITTILLSFLIGDKNNGYIDINVSYQSKVSADFDFQNQRWLVVYDRTGGGISRKFVGIDKSVSVESTLKSDANIEGPNIKFGCYGGTCRYLLTYMKKNDSTYDIYFDILDTNGNPVVSDIKLNTEPVYHEKITHDNGIAFDPTRGRFFVVYSERLSDGTNYSFDITGVFIDINGNVIKRVLISEAQGNQVKPDVAYSPEKDKYIVVWEDYRSDSAGDIYFQFIRGEDGEREWENSAVSFAPERVEKGPLVLWIPNEGRFAVFFRTSSFIYIDFERGWRYCPIIEGIPTCTNGHIVYSLVNPENGRVTYPRIVGINYNSRYAFSNLATQYVVGAISMYEPHHPRIYSFVISGLSSTTVSYLKANPTFWFPDQFGITDSIVPPPEGFCAPSRATGYLEILPPDYIIEEKKTKSERIALFPKSLSEDSQSAFTYLFVSGTTYPGITTALAIFGDWTGNKDKIRMITLDINPVMFDYDSPEETTLPHAVTNSCYITYENSPDLCSSSSSYQIRVTGGTPPYTFEAVAGEMPPGLTVNYNGTITGFVPPVDIYSVCPEYPCPFTFAVYVKDSSNPPKSSCMSFEILLFPQPQVDLLYPEYITICAPKGATETVTQEIQIQNIGTPVTIQVINPTLYSLYDPSSGSTSSCITNPLSADRFRFEVFNTPTTFNMNMCFNIPSIGTVCNCSGFSYELYPGQNLSASVTFDPNGATGEHNREFTFRVTEAIKRSFTTTATIHINAVIVEQDITISFEGEITHISRDCSEPSTSCSPSIDIYTKPIPIDSYIDSLTFTIKNTVDDSVKEKCGSSSVYLSVPTIYSPPSESFKIVSPTPSMFGIISDVKIGLGETFPVSLSVNGTSAGEITGTVFIFSDDPDEGIITLVFHTSVSAPTIEVPGTIDCGVTLKNTEIKCPLKIRNVSDIPAKITGAQLFGSTYFSISNPTTNFIIPSHSEYDFEVAFSSPTTGPYAGVLAFYSRSATPVLYSTIIVQVLDEEQVYKVTPKVVDFGQSPTSIPITKSVEFTNISRTGIYVIPGGVDSPFSFPSSASFYLGEFERGDFQIRFSPPSTGNFASIATFTIAEASGRFSFQVTVPAFGEGIESIPDINAVIIPNSVNFGTHVLCSPKKCSPQSKSISIINTGSIPLSLQNLYHSTLTGNTSISLISSPSPPITINPGQTIELNISSSPSQIGNYQGVLTFQFSTTYYSFQKNITFYGISVSPSISLSPTYLDFGSVKTGEQKIMQVSISNSGSWELNVTSISNPSHEFEILTPTPFKLQPQSQTYLVISFQPTSPQSYYSIISIFSDAPYSEEITLPVFGEGIESIPDISAVIVPNSVNFGTHVLCSPKKCSPQSKSISIINTGSIPLSLQNLYHSTLTGNTSISLISSPSPPITINPGQTIELNISSSPSQIGNYQGVLTFQFSTTYYSFQKNITFYGISVSPSISLSPTYLDFGSVKTGEQKIMQVSISNSGSWELNVTSISNPSHEFEILTPTPFKLQPQSQTYLVISFQPTSPQSYYSIISIFSDAPYSEEITLPVFGTGEENPMPKISVSRNEVDFGKVRVGRKAEEIIKVRNIGVSPLYISEITLTGSSDEFGVYIQDNFPIKMDYGKEITFRVEFSPREIGSKQNSVVIKSNDPEKAEITIPLSGEGAEPKVVFPESISFGSVRKGKTKKEIFRIENQGNMPISITLYFVGDKEFSIKHIGGTYAEAESENKFPIELGERSSSSFEVSFTPSELNEFSAKIVIESGDPALTYKEVSITGKGGFPVFSISSTNVYFGSIFYDEKSIEKIEIENKGNAPLEVTAEVSEGVEFFSVSATSFQVMEGEKISLSIEFTPNGKRGELSGKLKLFTDDPEKPEVFVVLYGTSRKIAVLPAGGGGCYSIAYPKTSGREKIESILFISTILIFFAIRKIKTKAKMKMSEENKNNDNNEEIKGEKRYFQVQKIGKRPKVIFIFALIFSLNLLLSEKAGSDDEIQEVISNTSIYNIYPYQDFSRFMYIREPSVRKKGTSGASFLLSFSKSPLILKFKKDEKTVREINVVDSYIESGLIISHSITNEIEASIFFSSFLVNWQEYQGRDRFKVSDIHLEGKMAIFNQRKFSVSLNPRLGIPVGSSLFGSRFSPYIGFLASGDDLKIGGGIKAKITGNIGFQYRNTTKAGDIFYGPRIFSALGVSLNYDKVGLSVESYAFFPLKDFRQENIPAEIAVSTGYGKNPGIRGGIIFGLTDGIGTPQYKFAILGGYEIFPQSPPVKYRKIDGFVKGVEGEEVQKGIVIVQPLGISTEIENGKFSLYIPEGSWKIRVISPGYEVKEQNIDTSDIAGNINFELLPLNPKLIIFALNEAEIPKESEIKVNLKRKGEERIFYSDYVIVRGNNEEVDINLADSGEKISFFVPEDKIVWVNYKIGGKTEKKILQKSIDDVLAKFLKVEDDGGGAEGNKKSENTQQGGEKGTEKDKDKDKAKDEKKGKAETKQQKVDEKAKQEKQEQKKEQGKEELVKSEKGEELDLIKDIIKSKDEEKARKEAMEKAKEILTKLESPKPDTSKKEKPKEPQQAGEKKPTRKISAIALEFVDKFESNKWDIPPHGYKILDELVKIIKENSGRIHSIRIEGHTDSVESEENKLELSYKRADEVRKYLYRKGVEIPVEIIGFGKLKPRFPDDSEENRKRNRRVEIKVNIITTQ